MQVGVVGQALRTHGIRAFAADALPCAPLDDALLGHPREGLTGHRRQRRAGEGSGHIPDRLLVPRDRGGVDSIEIDALFSQAEVNEVLARANGIRVGAALYDAR